MGAVPDACRAFMVEWFEAITVRPYAMSWFFTA